MNVRSRLLWEVAGHALSQGAALLVSAGLMLAVAANLGPAAFGEWSGLLAVAALLMPAASLRIETRLALAHSDEARQTLVSAALTACAGFALAGSGLSWIAAPWWAPEAVLMTCLTASLTCAIEAVIGACASQGAATLLRLLRFTRFVLPACGAWLVGSSHSGWTGAMIGWTVGLALTLLIALWGWGGVSLSLASVRHCWRQHGTGLRGSLWMGMLNAVWLNGLLPALNLLGLSALAGQYAVVQRLLGAPLGVVAMAIQATLLRAGNGLHRAPHRMLSLALVLAAAAAALSGLLGWGLFFQSWWVVPPLWKMPPELCAAAAFFLGSSFAVGSISVAAIRLNDEAFLAAWQTVALLIWCVGLWMVPTLVGVLALLWLGGLAYWLLLWRWVRVARREIGIYG